MQTPYFTDEEAKKLADYIIENAKKLVSSHNVRLRREYPNQEHLAGYNRLIVDVTDLGTIEFYFTTQASIVNVIQQTSIKRTINSFTKEQIDKSGLYTAYIEVHKVLNEKGLDEGKIDKDNFFKNR